MKAKKSVASLMGMSMVAASLISGVTPGASAAATTQSLESQSLSRANSPAVRASKRWTVRANSSAGWAETTKTIRVTGKTSRGAKGLKAKVQYKVRGKWISLRSTKISKQGKFSTTVKPGLGTMSYRVLVPGKKKRKAGVSKSFRLTGHKWFELDWYGRKNDSNVSPPFAYEKYTFGGRDYGVPIRPSEYASWIEWDLNRKCRKFDAVFGAIDQLSDPGISRGIVVTMDSSTVTSKTVKRGPVQRVSVNMSAGYYLRISFPAGSHSARAGVAVPKVLCKGDPRY